MRGMVPKKTRVRRQPDVQNLVSDELAGHTSKTKDGD